MECINDIAFRIMDWYVLCYVHFVHTCYVPGGITTLVHMHFFIVGKIAYVIIQMVYVKFKKLQNDIKVNYSMR